MTGVPSDLVGLRLALDDGPVLDAFALAGEGGAVFSSGGRLLVGVGEALTLELPSGLADRPGVAGVGERLARIRVEDRLARSGRWKGPVPSPLVAFGSLPFDRHTAASLTVPELLYVREEDGAEWVTVVGHGPPSPLDGCGGLRSWLRARSAAVHRDTASDRPPVAVTTPRAPDSSFRAMVDEVLAAIARGQVAKVVLARQVDARFADPVDVVALLHRWQGLEPNCAVFSLPTPEGQLVGASPELLVARAGTVVRSRPLAGTTGRPTGSGEPPVGGDQRTAGELLRSGKDGNEHRLVVEAISEVLGPLCDTLEVPDHPDPVHLRSITHLGTSVTGTLAVGEDGSVPTALELVAALHPTPAVGGVPRDRALELLTRLEPDRRGHYAGPVGYVDGDGDGAWMIGIRAATIAGSSARLAAGVGIVAGSDPDRELAETELKLAAAFAALAPGLPWPSGGRERAAG